MKEWRLSKSTNIKLHAGLKTGHIMDLSQLWIICHCKLLKIEIRFECSKYQEIFSNFNTFFKICFSWILNCKANSIFKDSWPWNGKQALSLKLSASLYNSKTLRINCCLHRKTVRSIPSCRCSPVSVLCQCFLNSSSFIARILSKVNTLHDRPFSSEQHKSFSSWLAAIISLFFLETPLISGMTTE